MCGTKTSGPEFQADQFDLDIKKDYTTVSGTWIKLIFSGRSVFPVTGGDLGQITTWWRCCRGNSSVRRLIGIEDI